MKVSLLLSIYNGELFLKEQIESIMNQTYTDWELYVRDDGSNDDSKKIVDEYINQYPKKIHWIKDSQGNLKSASSFMYMLSIIESDYYMFCDQDDVWFPFKIEKTLSRIKEVETVNPNKGVLIFTDLTIVNSDLKIINSSMWSYSNINPENAKDFYKTSCLSSVTGCTIMINNYIKEKALPFPTVARMHDWWITLNASHYGIVDYLNESTIYYRQHNNNVLGADQITQNHYLKRVLSLRNTINENIEVLKMLRALDFKKNYFIVFWTKIKIILIKLL
jgi:glycosyltransferase involved in cell wall biosynthesis